MHNRQVTLVPQRLERCERGMQSKEAVEINDRSSGNVDRRSHGVIRRLAVWHHDVEAVCRTALEDDHQALVAIPGFHRTKRGAGEERRNGRSADHGQPTVAKKYAASDGHKTSSWLLALSFWL